jgi:hypothetical protein
MSPKEMRRAEILLLRAIFAFLKIVKTPVRSYARTVLELVPKNAKKILVFVIGIDHSDEW